MTIDYTKYTLEELIDVNENINKKQYPERYKSLCAELERRKKYGDSQKHEQETDYDDDDDEHELIIEFSADGTNRKLFIALFFIINIIALAFIVPKYIVKDIVDVHEYATTVDFIECGTIEVVNDETDIVTTYFDLNIRSYQDNFSAVGITEGKCKKLANLPLGSSVSIWHVDGLIYQLKKSNDMLLSYNYMKPKIQELQTENVYFYGVGLLFLWLFLFKSLANAFVPGTFTRD